jgi:hypothetical protein
MKLCIFRAILHGVREAAQSVARCWWNIHKVFCVSPLMLQFHNIANITKQLPDQFPPTQKTTDTELTYQQWRIQRSCVIAVM